MPLITDLSQALGLPPRFVLFLLLGRHFLSFLQRGLGRRKQSTLFLVMLGSFTRRVSLENGGIGKAILGEVRLCSSFTQRFSDRLLTSPLFTELPGRVVFSETGFPA